jgi:hypothetical protein
MPIVAVACRKGFEYAYKSWTMLKFGTTNLIQVLIRILNALYRIEICIYIFIYIVKIAKYTYLKNESKTYDILKHFKSGIFMKDMGWVLKYVVHKRPLPKGLEDQVEQIERR